MLWLPEDVRVAVELEAAELEAADRRAEAAERKAEAAERRAAKRRADRRGCVLAVLISLAPLVFIIALVAANVERKPLERPRGYHYIGRYVPPRFKTNKQVKNKIADKIGRKRRADKKAYSQYKRTW
jgi:hypothetical protein